MIDPALIGRFGPEFDVPIERGKIREFASACYAPWPQFLDEPHAVIPPTFLMSANVFWGYTLERPRGTLLEALDHDLSVALHAEESYIFHCAPPRAGDVLTARACLEEVVEKQGKRGGALTFLTLLTEFRNPSGKLVAEARSVTATTDTPGTVAAVAPEYTPIHCGREPLDPFAAIVPENLISVQVGDSPGRIDMGPLSLREVVRYAAAGGEDDPLHYDLAHAKAAGFPGMFGLGMHQAGALAIYAARWLGAARARACHSRFRAMFFVGEELSYEGWIAAIDTVDGRRVAQVNLQCLRRRDQAVIVDVIMRFDLDA